MSEQYSVNAIFHYDEFSRQLSGFQIQFFGVSRSTSRLAPAYEACNDAEYRHGHTPESLPL